MKDSLPHSDLDSFDELSLNDVLKQQRCFDRGNDSEVYKFGEYVVKYYRLRSPAQILFYQRITNLVKEYTGQYFNQTSFGPLVLEVEPILKVIPRSIYEVYTISLFVGGIRPKDDADYQLTELLDRFSIDMIRTTGYRGIRVVASNTKVDPRQHVCTITDLCTSILELRKK